MNVNFRSENIDSSFIKGTCLEFSEVIKTNGVIRTEYKYSIDDFLEDNVMLNKIKEAGLTHVFVHICLYIDERKGKLGSDNIIYYNNLTLKNHYEQRDCELVDDFEWNNELLKKYSLVFKKIVKAGLSPIIKIMNDNYDNNNHKKINDPYVFFNDYLSLTKSILDADSMCNVDIITIANESAHIRSYMGLREYWVKYIQEVRNYRLNKGKEIKISMSQFFHDIVNGQCIITDLVDIIGFNYYPSIPNSIVPAVDDVIKEIYSNDIYTIQQYCKSLDKDFIITEYGCSCWEMQAIEPEQGNSMALYYKKKNNYLVQAAYLQGGCIAIPMLDRCIGLDMGSVNKGGNYNWIYKCNIDTPKAKENLVSYNAVKCIWGNVEDVIYDDEHKLWFSYSKRKYLSKRNIEEA